jgi:hypothetical protein
VERTLVAILLTERGLLIAELLIDLEEDEPARLRLVAALRATREMQPFAPKAIVELAFKVLEVGHDPPSLACGAIQGGTAVELRMHASSGRAVPLLRGG